jgi:tetratricopeptide (TPR) repeat protein
MIDSLIAAGGSVALRYAAWNVIRLPKRGRLAPEGHKRIFDAELMLRTAQNPQPSDPDLPIFLDADEPLNEVERAEALRVTPAQMALRLFARATGCGAASADLWRDRGLAAMEVGMHDAAVVEFQRCIGVIRSQPPGDFRDDVLSECLGLCGVSLVTLGDRTAAASVFAEVLSIGQGASFRAYSNAGNFFSQSGDHDKAIRAHTTAFQIRPDIPAIALNFIRALERANRTHDVRDVLQAALQHNPNDEYLLHSLHQLENAN